MLRILLMRAKLQLAAAVASLRLLTTSAMAQPFAYAVNSANDLYLVNLATAQKTLIGWTEANLLEGLALSPTGELYGTDASDNFYLINRNSGVATLRGGMRFGTSGLVFDGATLLGISIYAPTIFSINPANGATTNLITAKTNIQAQAMTLLDSDTVFLSRTGVSNTPLYKVSLSTGDATTVGVLQGYSYAMGFAPDGYLYTLGDSGALYRVDPNTASQTLIGNTGGDTWLDMTIVPEPGTATLLILGFLVFSRFSAKGKTLCSMSHRGFGPQPLQNFAPGSAGFPVTLEVGKRVV